MKQLKREKKEKAPKPKKEKAPKPKKEKKQKKPKKGKKGAAPELENPEEGVVETGKKSKKKMLLMILLPVLVLAVGAAVFDGEKFQLVKRAPISETELVGCFPEADVILLEDDLRRIVDAIKIAKETLKVVERNVTFALFIKALVMVLSVMGYFSMSQAITAEVGVMFMALLNSAWISKYTV